jgi:hypothetical protein
MDTKKTAPFVIPAKAGIQVIFLILFFLVVANCRAQPNNSMLTTAAFKMLDTYCSLEFHYDTYKRDELFTTTKEYDKENYVPDYGSGDCIYPGVLYIDTDKIFLVRSYKILSVIIDGKDKNRAIGTVSYNVLAKRDRWPEKNDGYDGLHEYHNPNYIEKINLIYDGKYWRILNPPPAKISIDEVTGIYTSGLQSITEAHRGELLDAQQLKNYYSYLNSQKQIVALLKGLGGDPSKATNMFAKNPIPEYPMQNPTPEDIIKHMTDVFLQGEFSGDDFKKRISVIRYSPSMQRKLEALYYIYPSMVIWKINPLFVVSDYKILNIEYVRDKTNKITAANITVQYNRLARSEGDGSSGVLSRRLVQDYEPKEIVILKVTFANDRGIIDPPPPHISKDALITYYENDIKSFGDNYLARTDITDQQKQEYQKELDTLEFLKKL